MTAAARPRRHAGHAAWTARAACRGHLEPELWWPDANNIRSIRRALAVCRTCPVLAECREWALKHMPDSEGIAGGLTGPQRRALRGGPR